MNSMPIPKSIRDQYENGMAAQGGLSGRKQSNRGGRSYEEALLVCLFELAREHPEKINRCEKPGLLFQSWLEQADESQRWGGLIEILSELYREASGE